ncbi:MAG: AbrB/MazE/SpoVT family DNA-binding domain-containing protein [Nitrospinae bacterium]|nr:AbrB/MazE/SpoVT family DNA-binding domain-containing protein [Nitrospinota bacterium]
MVESTITSKGRTTIPKSVREALGVNPGDRVRYLVQGDEVRITPVRPLARLFGALKFDGPPVTLEEMERAIADGACEE